MEGIYIGLMSGTSLDAIDAVAIQIDQSKVILLNSLSSPIPSSIRQSILALCRSGPDEIHQSMTLDRIMGESFATTVLQLLDQANLEPRHITAIGSHGQTIRHYPFGSEAYSLQIGDPNTIAERTGILTVADFRRRDIAAGGQGAPLIPLFHKTLLLDKTPQAAVLNIGGMANFSAFDSSGSLIGCDTGPGNVLLDAWIQQHRGFNYDTNGVWAQNGELDTRLLERMLRDEYFALPPPKSTGRERFNLDWIQRILRDHEAATGYSMAPQSVQTTLTELTALSIANELKRLPEIHTLFCCGGGARNDYLLSRIQTALRTFYPQSRVCSTDEVGLPADWIEAMGFAWFAYRTLSHHSCSLAAVTGATHDCVTGGIYPGKRRVTVRFEE